MISIGVDPSSSAKSCRLAAMKQLVANYLEVSARHLPHFLQPVASANRFADVINMSFQLASTLFAGQPFTFFFSHVDYV
jgi:hypothetical protein